MRLVMTLAVLMLTASAGTAAELSLPAVAGAPGETVTIPVMIDAVENLAGIKLVMTYDVDFLAFQKAAKTRATASLMHIVNDRKPGMLIIVMAGARGIRGRDFPLLRLDFTIKASVRPPAETALDITAIQLMSDKLKEFPGKARVHPVRIRAGSAGGGKPPAPGDGK